MASFDPTRAATSEDPRRLWEHFGRLRQLAAEHRIRSVVVGLAAPEGDLQFPDVVRFMESELRVEDSVFRMTRERAVLFLADVDREGARRIVERLLLGFQQQFPADEDPRVAAGYFEVDPGDSNPSVGVALQAVFAAPMPTTH